MNDRAVKSPFISVRSGLVNVSRTRPQQKKNKKRPTQSQMAAVKALRRRIVKERRRSDKLAVRPIGKLFEDLVGIQARLRAPGGCPWDREQTHLTL